MTTTLPIPPPRTNNNGIPITRLVNDLQIGYRYPTPPPLLTHTPTIPLPQFLNSAPRRAQQLVLPLSAERTLVIQKASRRGGGSWQAGDDGSLWWNVKTRGADWSIGGLPSAVRHPTSRPSGIPPAHRRIRPSVQPHSVISKNVIDD